MDKKEHINNKNPLYIVFQILKESLYYNRWLLLIASLLLIIPMIIAYFFRNDLKFAMEPAIKQLQENISKDKFTFKDIYLNNANVALLLYMGSLTFGLIPAFILISNGALIGYATIHSPSLIDFLILILPHGIFELPAIIIGAAGSFRLSLFFIKFINYSVDEKKLLSKILKYNADYSSNIYNNNIYNNNPDRNNDYIDNYNDNNKYNDLNEHNEFLIKYVSNASSGTPINFLETMKASYILTKNDIDSSFVLLLLCLFLLLIAAFIETKITLLLYYFIKMKFLV